MPELTTAHLIAGAVWLIACAIVATAWAITRKRWLLYTLIALAAPIVGAVWALTLVRREEAPERQPPTTPHDLEEMADAIPDDDPRVSDARRERAERRAGAAIAHDDQSREHVEQLERELADLLDD